MSSSSKVSPPPVDTETLRQRLLIKDHSATRASLSKCVIRFRDFAHLSLAAAATEAGSDNSDKLFSLNLIKEELERELELYDLEMQKLALGAKAAECELSHYESISKGTQSDIVESKTEIESLKTILSQEKEVIKNRAEYESLAKMVIERPSSRLVKNQLVVVRKEIDEIRFDANKVEKEVGVKEKQFQLLMQSIYDLKSSLAEDKSRESLENKRKRSHHQISDLIEIDEKDPQKIS